MPAIMEARQNVRQMLGAWWRIAVDGAVLAAAPAPSRTGAVCIVHLGAIGDFVLWLDAGRRLSRHYRESGSKVVLVANAAWAPWARELELAHEVWEIDPARFDRDFGHRSRWLRRMRAGGLRHGAAADAFENRDGGPIPWCARARHRHGSARPGDCANTPARLKRHADAWYTRLIACGDVSRMELLRNADFMRGLGFTDFRAQGPELGGGLPANPTGLAHKSYAVLVPGAGVEWRAWPVSSFAEVGRRLAAQGLGGGHRGRTRRSRRRRSPAA